MTQEVDAVVTLTKVGAHVAVITLNRPERRNSINGEMTRLLAQYHAEVEAAPEIRAVVLTSSSPQVFCAGADLGEIAAGRRDSLVTEEGGFAGFVRLPKRKVWIAAMAGHALAGGLEIALACHIRISGQGTNLGLPETKFGMLAGAGGVDRLPTLVPRGIAIELLCTGQPITAERAAEIGLVNHVLPPAEVLYRALRLAEVIAGNAPLAVQASLRFAMSAGLSDPAAHLAEMTRAQYALYDGKDCAEGARAFVEKRPPVWTMS